MVVPAAAEAATPGCPSGTPGVGGRAFIGGAGDDVITGTPGDDYICAGAGNDTVNGGGGSDHIYGGTGDDSLSGGPGDDWIVGSAGSDRIYGNAGSDQIFADAGPAFQDVPVVTSQAGNDLVWGGSGSDVISGGPGSDIVFAGGGGERGLVGDIVHGDSGNDVILSDPRRISASDSFFGDDGDDFLWPNPIRTNPLGNVVWGGAGHDVIITANGLSDGVELGEPHGIKVPVGSSGCSVTIPVLEDTPAGSPSAVKCAIPKLGAYSLSVTAGSDSKVSLKGPLFGLMTKVSVGDLRKVASGGFSADVCLCDPDIRGWAVADRVDP